MPAHPKIGKYAKEISGRAQYPIKTIDELMKALGGDDVAIEFEGPRGAARNLRKVIPAEFFPVKSEADLVEKSEKLRAKHMS